MRRERNKPAEPRKTTPAAAPKARAPRRRAARATPPVIAAPLPPGLQTALPKALLAWYDRCRRDLPWRSDNPNPYHVLVSETMLQQTRVATVIDYFQRFITALPTLAALAAAPEQQVLALWQGLGYYRRARNLHACAQAVVQRHGGIAPQQVDELQALPGIGRYTAGAVASIAFAKQVPLVDGNVARVLARVLAVHEPADDPKVREQLWQAAAALVPRKRPGDFNQALMELGALVCLPGVPDCGRCPLQSCCQAHAQGLTQELPRLTPRRKPQARRHQVLALCREGRYLLQQRGERGLWSAMWELPTLETAFAAEELPGQIRRQWGLTVGPLEELGGFTHQTTHRTIGFTVYYGHAAAGEADSAMENGGLPASANAQGDSQPPQLWRELDNLADLPMSKAQQRALELVRRRGTSARSS